MRGGALAAPVGALTLACALSGCGIQSTPVPVDAGPAPTRVSCALPDRPEPGDGTAFGAATVRLYLVCSQRLSPVRRAIRGRRIGHVETARLLLGELETDPDPAEEKAGFSSEVPDGLGVTGPDPGDPPGALRLDQDPVQLPSYAVGQLVCTFADTEAGASGDSVVLGGPRAGSATRRYTCDDALRTDPDAGPTAGTPVR